MVNSFPLKGVIGIVANNTAEIDFALDHKLSCVEIRADLLINGGTSIDDVVELIRGPKGSKVRLEIIPSSALSDTETKEIQIVRNVVKLEDQALITENGYENLSAWTLDREKFERL